MRQAVKCAVKVGMISVEVGPELCGEAVLLIVEGGLACYDLY
jgi:hypothetical protein